MSSMLPIIFRTLLILGVVLAHGVAGAEELAVCRSEVAYSWTKDPKDERVVFFAVVEQRAPSVEDAKRKLAEEVARVKGDAYQRCREAHQNLSGCIAGRFNAHTGVMSSMTFAARKALEEAITTDCKGEQGTCGAVTASEPQCKEPPPPPEASGGAAPEEKKGETSKKKK